MKRLATTLVAVVAFSIGGSIPSAAAGGGATSDTFPVSFTVTSQTCGYLPANTTVTGSGMETSITVVRTDASGATTITNSTHATGTATDGHNTYVWNYSNAFRVTNTPAHPDTFSGSMSDSFSLAGNGPARLHNGFVADLTTNGSFTYISWSVHASRGDPISFATGPVVSHCDPL